MMAIFAQFQPTAKPFFLSFLSSENISLLKSSTKKIEFKNFK